MSLSRNRITNSHTGWIPIEQKFTGTNCSLRSVAFLLRLALTRLTAFASKDLKANESRLKDINKVAEDLESEGLMAEEVQAVQQQVGIRISR